MALVEGLRSEFADHDVYLHLLLGLVSASRRLERLLPEAPPSTPLEPLPALTAEEERRVLVVLGLLSVRRTLMGTLEPLRAARSASTSVEEGSAPQALPRALELLR